MGVGISVDVGVGFILDEDEFNKFLRENDPEDVGEYEVMEHILRKEELLTFGTGGSYFDSGEDNRTWVAVKRLHRSHDMHDIPGGVFGLNKPVITVQERIALETTALNLGQTRCEVGQFLSVLWH